MGIGKLFHRHAPKGVFDISGGRVPGFGPKPKKRMKWEGKRGPDFGGTSTDWGAFPEHDWEMPDYKSAQWAKARLAEKHDNPFFLAIVPVQLLLPAQPASHERACSRELR